MSEVLAQLEKKGGGSENVLAIFSQWDGNLVLINPKTCTGTSASNNSNATWNGITIKSRTWVNGSTRYNTITFVSGYTGKFFYKLGTQDIVETQVTTGTEIHHDNYNLWGYIVLE